MKLRQGRKVGRTLYLMKARTPSDTDVLIGVVDHPALAALIVRAVNADHVTVNGCDQPGCTCRYCQPGARRGGFERTPWTAERVDCPACAAPAGEPCRTRGSGAVAKEPHQARQAAEASARGEGDRG